MEEELKEKGEMSFLDHLDVLRKHLLRIVKVGLVMFIVALVFTKPYIVNFITGPIREDFISYKILCQISQKMGKDFFCEMPNLKDIDLHFFTIWGQFGAYFLVAFTVTIIFLFPYAFMEIWTFIKPALRSKEKRVTRGAVFFVGLLFTVGAFFGFYIISPISINFLTDFNLFENAKNTIQFKSYFSYFTMLVLGTGLMFQLPIAMFFLGRLGLVTSKGLATKRKIAVIVILLVSAIITPPDITSQVLVGIPIYILYEVSILILMITQKRRKTI